MKISELPYSSHIDISSLLQVFNSTAASYKYIFFLSLLDVLEKVDFAPARSMVSLDDILIEMLANAWYPHVYFKLDFGVNDRIARSLDELKLSDDSVLIKGVGDERNTLRRLIRQRPYTDNDLLDMVPYRLINPFFIESTRGVRDARKNDLIVKLASERFDEVRPFYYITEDRKSLVMNHYWLMYFYENRAVLRSFISWNWLDYMQRRNPSVPNLSAKLFPPLRRNSLGPQRNYWKRIVRNSPIHCIFTDEPIREADLSVDHFLPWTFVAHDQLWNLLPVSKSVNSSKSNNLPSRDSYLERFIDLQHKGLSVYRELSTEKQWGSVIEPYITDLHIDREQLLNRQTFSRGLSELMTPLFDIARLQGFSADWVYSKA